jgi:hypothetical protein
MSPGETTPRIPRAGLIAKDAIASGRPGGLGGVVTSSRGPGPGSPDVGFACLRNLGVIDGQVFHRFDTFGLDAGNACKALSDVVNERVVP